MKYRVLALLIALFLYYFTHHDIAHADGEITTNDSSESQSSSSNSTDSAKPPAGLVSHLSKTTNAVTDVVKDTTDHVSTTVDQATTDADQIVKDAVDIPAQVITEVNKAANGQSSDVIGSVTSSVEQTIDNTTGTVQHAVENTTNTVTDVVDNTVQTTNDAVTSIVDSATTVIPEIVPVPDVPVIHLPPIVPQLPVEVKPTPVPEGSVTPTPSTSPKVKDHSKTNSTQGKPVNLPSKQPVQPAVPSVNIATQSPATEAVQSSPINESNDKDPSVATSPVTQNKNKQVPNIPKPISKEAKSTTQPSNATAQPLDDSLSNGSTTNALVSSLPARVDQDTNPSAKVDNGTLPVSPLAAIWLDFKGVQGLIASSSSSTVEGSTGGNGSNGQNVFVNHQLANWKLYRTSLLTYRAQSEHGNNQWTHAPPGQPPQEAPYFI